MGKEIDIWFFISLIFISFFSLFNLFGIKREFFWNQLVFFIIGFGVFFIFFRININFLKNNSQIFYFFSLLILTITFFLAPEIRGSKRWLTFYFFNFQPSEFLKPFFIIYLSDFLTKKTFSLIGVLFLILPIFLIFKQPDLGTAIIYLIILLGLLFFKKNSFRWLFYSLGIFIILSPFFWFFLKDYQKTRIISFLNPNLDPQGTSYNLVQSIITIGAGGIFGRGLGLGTQSRLYFLPENHTDFVFASLVEQFGFLGGSILIFLYGLIIWRIIKKIFFLSQKDFSYFFLIGVVLLILSSVFINIGMTLGILPVTGIVLPLVSYGGSSIVSMMIVLGLTASLL